MLSLSVLRLAVRWMELRLSRITGEQVILQLRVRKAANGRKRGVWRVRQVLGLGKL